MSADIEYIVSAYGFLLPAYEVISGSDFAQIIRSYYSISEPRNRYCADVAERYIKRVYRTINGIGYESQGV